MDPIQAARAAARDAHDRAAKLERKVLDRFPQAGQQMDQMRARPPMVVGSARSTAVPAPRRPA